MQHGKSIQHDLQNVPVFWFFFFFLKNKHGEKYCFNELLFRTYYVCLILNYKLLIKFI